VYILRDDGVAPSLVAVAAMTLLTAWWYSRKIRLSSPSLTVPQVKQEALGLLNLGVAFMASGLMTMGAAYVIRLIILRTIGVEATGLYQSAWTLGGLYIGFILQAMGADFYPRLTASANDNTACNRMVNEQARVGLLLGGPGAIGTLTFAPVVIALFYSAKFGAAVELLRWICLGAALRVLTWPMGFVILAKGRKGLFFWSELAWTIVNVGLTCACVPVFGLAGAGIAFAWSYIFHGVLIYHIVRRLSGFSWSAENRHTSLFFAALITAVFASFYIFPFELALCVGLLACIVSSGHSYHRLIRLVPLDRIMRPLRPLLNSIGITPSLFTTGN
jgi:antigen flippase